MYLFKCIACVYVYELSSYISIHMYSVNVKYICIHLCILAMHLYYKNNRNEKKDASLLGRYF